MPRPHNPMVEHGAHQGSRRQLRPEVFMIPGLDPAFALFVAALLLLMAYGPRKGRG
jgi:hypothetical protein